MQPEKLINVPSDMPLFAVSKAHSRLEALIQSFSRSVAGKVIGSTATNSIVQGIIDILNSFYDLAEEIEPIKERQRFGNTAFRVWSEKVQDKARGLLEELPIPDPHSPELRELSYYFQSSFGSAQRLDYGSGHELNFVAFFGGIVALNITGQPVDGQDILTAFAAYYRVCRKIITRYNLEPAGSHGVWGLDDHFHLVYILGAAQLAFGADDGTLMPKDVLNQKITQEFAPKNLYFGAINFIYQVKRGPFFEHSPILYDVSGVATWTKIQRGMVKMYEDEVFSKFPVMQHFWFGSIYSLAKDPTTEPSQATVLPSQTMPPPTTQHREQVVPRHGR